MPILRGDRKHGAEGKPMTTKKSRVRFGHGFLFSSCPVGTGLPDVNMGEALSGVHTHAAPVRHQLPRICCHRRRGLTPHGNVSRRAVAVLAVGRAVHLLVILRRAVGAVNDHRNAKVAADALQHHHQPGRHQHGIGAVLASKFFHCKVCGQLLAAVLRLGMGVDLYHRFLSFRFVCVPAFLFPHQKERDHPSVSGEALPCRIHETGAPAAVHHDGVVPAGRGQQVTELFRCPPVLAHIVGEPSVLGADGRPGSAIAHIRPAGDGADLLPADDEVDALHVVRVPVWHGFYAEIPRCAPTDGPRPVIRGLADLPVCFQVTGRLLISQENGAVADGVPTRLRQHFPQVGRCGAETLPIEIDFQKLEVGERDCSSPRHFLRFVRL